MTEKLLPQPISFQSSTSKKKKMFVRTQQPDVEKLPVKEALAKI